MSKKKLTKKRLTRPLLLSLGAKESPHGLSLGFKHEHFLFEKCRGGWNIYVGMNYSLSNPPYYIQTVEDLFNCIHELGSKRGRNSLRQDLRVTVRKFLDVEG